MRIARKISFSLTTLVVALSIPLAMATPALAAPSCAAGSICVWSGTSYTGTKVTLAIPNVIGTCATLPQPGKNMASSYVSNVSIHIVWEDYDGCMGDDLMSTYKGYSPTVPSSADNRVNSFLAVSW